MPRKPKKHLRRWDNERGAGLFSNYGGPGGAGRTLHPTDELFKKHDEDYGELSQHHPYIRNNDADRVLVEGLRNRRKQGGLTPREAIINYAADAYFTTKRALPLRNIPRRRTRQPRPAVNMTDTPTPAPEATATRALSSNSTTSSGSYETPVTNAKARYGLENTHTAVLPFDMYFSTFDLDNHTKRIPGTFSIDLTNPIQPFQTAITHVLENSTAAIATGIYDRPLRPDQTSWLNQVGIFPQQYAANGSVQWWNWWTQIYDSYHVIGVHWRLTCDNQGYSQHDDVVIAYGVDTFTADDTTNKMPNAPMFEDIQRWENTLQYKFVEGTTQGGLAYNLAPPVLEGNPVILEGTYHPYEKPTIVMNDAEHRTWSYVNQAPTLREQMKFYIYTAPLSTNEAVRLNFRLEMKFIVQFKDLKNQFHFPINAETNMIDLVNIADTHQAWLAHT